MFEIILRCFRIFIKIFCFYFNEKHGKNKYPLRRPGIIRTDLIKGHFNLIVYYHYQLNIICIDICRILCNLPNTDNDSSLELRAYGMRSLGCSKRHGCK